MDLPDIGKVINLIMVLETHGGVKRTVLISELLLTLCGMIVHVELLCIGSVKKCHKKHEDMCTYFAN